METPNVGGKYRYYNKNGGISWRGYLYEAIHDFIENINLLDKGKSIDDLKGSYPSPEEAIFSTMIGEAIHTSILENRTIVL
jgi:hypothetical protein